MSNKAKFFERNKVDEPNYESDGKDLALFLRKNATYQKYIQEIKDLERNRLVVELDDIEEFFDSSEMATRIERNVKRYVKITTVIVDAILETLEMSEGIPEIHDIVSHYERQRKELERSENDLNEEGEERRTSIKTIPRGLCRRFYVNFKTRRKMPTVALRNIKSQHIGKLVKTRGIVHRVSDVKSEIKFACYLCDTCNDQEFVEVFDQVFMPKSECEKCKRRKVAGAMVLFSRGSRFERFQQLVISELNDETPTGNVPRKMKVHVRGSLTRKCGPGDEVLLSACFLQFPNYQYGKNVKELGTFLEAMDIILVKRKYKDMIRDSNLMEQIEKFHRENTTLEVYEKLARSIAPEIHGMLDVKKALLLQLVGGTTKTLDSGVKIRGDINICMVGDPGVGKSQLLKYISQLSPRGVYTTGKGSSAVGLTAAVIRDKTSGEYVLEGGALVLSDRGVCCVDEFDKMNDFDITALHEVMEQQSISIAKAGITTTLNARASILAAANPQWGSYNRKKSVTENVDMPSALLSRFDLLFLLLDKNTREYNSQLAKHILNVHRYYGLNKNEDDEDENEFVTLEFLKGYIAKSKDYFPSVASTLKPFIIDLYATMRQMNGTDEIYGSTPRTLLSILRLSQALAKLRFRREVDAEDLKEARRLMDSCKASLMENYEPARATKLNSTDLVLSIVKQHYADTDVSVVQLDDLVPKFTLSGISKEDVTNALNEYSQLGVLVWDQDDNTVTLNL